MAESVRYFDSKKLMWDGSEYADRAAAEAAAEKYRADGFDVRLVEEADKAFVYTRRVATEIVVSG
jgi:hypothetical protein